MGRKRSSNPLDLPPRLYWHHGAFWYRHRTGKAERLGTDVTAAKDRARHYNDPDSTFGTVAWFFDDFLVHFGRQVAAGAKAQRTLDDYTEAGVPLKAFFGKMAPANVKPHHVARYLDIGVEAGYVARSTANAIADVVQQLTAPRAATSISVGDQVLQVLIAAGRITADDVRLANQLIGSRA